MPRPARDEGEGGEEEEEEEERGREGGGEGYSHYGEFQALMRKWISREVQKGNPPRGSLRGLRGSILSPLEKVFAPEL